MKFELDETLRGASDEDVLNDLRRVATLLEKETVTRSEFQKHGKCSAGTIERRFGSWNKGLGKAGLKISIQKDISDDELFENLRQMWVKLGRQPRYSEVKHPFSRFSNVTYDKRFGKFSEALKLFVKWTNSEQEENELSTEIEKSAPVLTVSIEKTLTTKRRTRREISDRQRFRILVRDGFRCKACGASPITQVGIELHVDHILPWSIGGETVDENLECKCSKCNLGKGNEFSV